MDQDLEILRHMVACDSALWNSIMYDSSGLYVDTLQSVAGCDSIIVLT